jgi:hypothetical protein
VRANRTAENGVPGVGAYDGLGDIDRLGTFAGPTLGERREVPSAQKDVPGPGSYEPQNAAALTSIAAGVFAKATGEVPIFATPGVGVYNMDSAPSTTQACTIGTRTFPPVSNAGQPGPCDYNVAPSSEGRSVTISQRITDRSELTPGPGEYVTALALDVRSAFMSSGGEQHPITAPQVAGSSSGPGNLPSTLQLARFVAALLLRRVRR